LHSYISYIQFERNKIYPLIEVAPIVATENLKVEVDKRWKLLVN